MGKEDLPDVLDKHTFMLLTTPTHMDDCRVGKGSRAMV